MHVVVERFRRALAVSVVALSVALLVSGAARADFKVKLPEVSPGEVEFEAVGSYGQSGRAGANNEQIFVKEIEYGVTNFWKTGLEFEFGRDAGPGNHFKFQQLTWENWLVLGEPGQYWLDPALFVEYGHGLLAGTPDEISIGPILRKQIGPAINTVNLFFEKEIGPFSSGRTFFQYKWETRLALGTSIEPGIQAYGEPGPVGHFAPISAQDHRIGPQLFGAVHQLGPGTLKFNAGFLFGLTPAAPRHTVRGQAEYEIHF